MKNSTQRNEMPCDFAGLRPRRLFLATLAVLGVMWCPSPAAASGFPVFDGASFTQLITQYAELVKQVDAAYQQIVLLQIQINAVTGHHTYNQILAPIDSGSIRSWDDISTMVARGMNPASATDQQIFQSGQRFAQQYPKLLPAMQPTDPTVNALYNKSFDSATSGFAVADSTLGQLNRDMSDIKDLTARIGTTDDLKSAMDLNTTVNAKLAALTGELLRVYAAQLAMQASERGAANAAYNVQAQFLAN